MASRNLVLFAREPRAGTVKTRLAAGVGPETAARLYAAFLEDLAAELVSSEWTSHLAHTGAAPGPGLLEMFGAWNPLAQGEGGLGERMARAIEALRRNEPGAEVVVVGSDAPTLTRLDVSRAFAALGAGCDVVLSPAPDGGYSLVGLGPRPRALDLFHEVRWSTPHTLADTLARAKRLGLVTRRLDAVPDVDVAADLDTLRERLAKDSRLAPATRRALEGLSAPRDAA